MLSQLKLVAASSIIRGAIVKPLPQANATKVVHESGTRTAGRTGAAETIFLFTCMEMLTFPLQRTFQQHAPLFDAQPARVPNPSPQIREERGPIRLAVLTMSALGGWPCITPPLVRAIWEKLLSAVETVKASSTRNTMKLAWPWDAHKR